MPKTPHIKVDAFPLVDKHFSGVGHATLGIVQGLDELAGEGKLTYSLIAPRRWAYKLDKYNLLNYKRIIKNPFPNRVIRGFMKFHLKVPMDLILGPGNYYFPSFLAWPTWFSRSSVVIHDVTYLAVPECVQKDNRDYLAKVAPFSIKNSKNIITVSNFSKKEIIKYYKYPADKISVAYNSVNQALFYRRTTQEVKSVRLKYDIYRPDYILSVGNIEPRKNQERLIEAYMSLPKDITDKYALVIIGAGGWNNEAILKKMQDAKEKGFVIINPKHFVADEDMPALYTGAKFYIFPPIYEGFGMSPLEAFACGTPVIASNVTSVPEAVGDAAVFINPYDARDIAQKMKNMLKDLDEDPDKYLEVMKKQIAKFSWHQSAITTAASVTGKSEEYFKDNNEY